MKSNQSPLSRFIRSMKMDYEKWRDGIGYDLEAIKEANEKELEAIEQILVNTNQWDWRDVEALAFLNTPKARSALKDIIPGNNELNMAVLRFAPELVNDELKTKLIVKSLESATFFYGLSQTLRIVQNYHPKEVIRELLDGLINREGEVAVHFAAMLFFIYGKTETYFPFENREFFLRFNTSKLSDRRILFKEVCEKIGVDCTEYLI